MTAQLLAGELTTLIQDTKRKAPEIRSTAEKSLADLKSLANTSESQLAADLRRRPEFIRPFLLACKAGNPKYATPAVISLQRLVAANGLAQERLEELLEALRDCSLLGADVQLRVLQVMPSLFQRYGDQISESRLATALQVCFVLQAAKSAIISHTAAATLQQIVNDVFTRVGTEKALAEVASPESSKTSWQAELDCHQVLQDLCLIAEGIPVESLKKANVSKDFALELLGTILLNHTTVIPKYTNFVDILRQQLLPLMLRVVSSGAPFPQTVRVLRLVPPVIQGLLEILPTELEMLLSMLAHMLEPDATSSWKRTMCMEALRDVYKEPSNIRRMYSLFDQEPGHKPIVQQQLAMLGRLSSEQPTIIGLGQRSSMPTVSEENSEDFDGLAALQADPLTATTGVSLTTKVATNSGIGVDLSTVKIALIDQLDKTEAPSVPPSYIYALVLTSVNLLCDGLAKFVLPFANLKTSKPQGRGGSREDDHSDESSDEGTETQLPTNPLELKDHPDAQHIRAVAGLLESCWPALLNTYSTFFQAALDGEYYHSTIRSFQKVVQVATLLRSATARDAFLTALAKQSLPREPGISIGQPEASSNDRRGSIATISAPRLSSRNLLCLRALLNLGIALGAVLDDAWSIVLSTLQQADIIIGHASTDRTLSKGGPASIAPTSSVSGELSKEFSTEVAAVRSAASRMLRSASELPQREYLRFLDLLDELLRGKLGSIGPSGRELGSSGHHRRSSSSTSNSKTEGLEDLRGDVFVIDVYSQMIDFGKIRLTSEGPNASGWASIVRSLLRLVVVFHLDQEVRLAAADTICKSVISATFGTSSEDRPETLIPNGLAILRQLVEAVQRPDVEGNARSGSFEIHNAALKTLKSCLDQYGDSVEQGWEDACALILSAFNPSEESLKANHTSFVPAEPHSQKLLRSAFGSLQVICSDLIDALPHACLPRILLAVYFCCSQTLDLNVSLTSTSLYQSLSDSIWTGQNHLDLDSLSSKTVSPRASLWVQLLNAISGATTSEQTEIRNSAVHACFRVFESVGDKLRAQDWAVCFRAVILRLYELNESVRPKTEHLVDTSAATLALDETAITIHSGTCAILEEYILVLLESEAKEAVWSVFVSHIDRLLERESLVLSASTFSSLAKVLGALPTEDSSFSECLASTWRVLLVHETYRHIRLDRPANSDNQAALIAFISCAAETYRVTSSGQRLKVAPQLLERVADSISKSTPTNYAGDLATVSSLQADCMKLLKYVYASTDAEISFPLLEVLARLSALSHTQKHEQESYKGPTFVAIANEVAVLVEQIVRERASSLDLQDQKSMISVLESFELLINHKRHWQREDKVVQIWQGATTTALNVLSSLLALSLERGKTESSVDVWVVALRVLNAILGMGEVVEEDDDFLTNLIFDIDSFNRIYELLVPSLGTTTRPGAATDLADFANVLFLRSLIHDPHPDDSLTPTNSSEWPKPGRIGRVRDLDPSPRTKLCYLLVDRLFELVIQAGKSRERTRLAKATAPYLRLRVELTMKAYITDQPLRGRMPCPLSQKKELVYLVQQSIAMDQGPDNTEEAQKLSHEHRQSLVGLAIMALRVTRSDEKIKTALLRLIEVSAPQFALT